MNISVLIRFYHALHTVDEQLTRATFDLFITGPLLYFENSKICTKPVDKSDVIACVGSETTADTLRWAFLILAQRPDVQERVRAEVHERIGRERAPRYSDRSALRYTEAVLNEVHRFASIVPTSTAHRATRDVELRGYLIPEDSIVHPNLCALLSIIQFYRIYKYS